MKLSLPLTVSYLVLTTIFSHSLTTTSAQLPTFQMELLSNHIEVLEYKYPFHNVFVSGIPISASTPKRVSDELVIYWRNNNPNHNEDLRTLESLPTEIRIKLTCRAPYWTKWEINSDLVESGSEQMMEASEFKYSLRPLPRDNEDPVSMSTDNAVKWEYNLTEVTINSFGSKFQSGTIDCVHHNDSQIKSRLRIFQRFVDINVNPFRSSLNKSLNYKTTSAIPCTVHDPVKVPYFESTKVGSDNWKNISGDFDYKWTIGFEPKETIVFKANTKYGCAFFEKCFDFLGRARQCTLHNVEYTIGNADTQKNEEDCYKKKDISSIVRNKVFKSVDGNGQETITFICELNKTERTRTTKLTAIRISSCTSPQYCVSSSGQNGARDYFETIIRCSDGQSKSCATIWNLPLESRVSESSVDFYGRVSCFGSVDKKSGISHDFYFTGLSGKISLLSEFDGQPPLSEIFTLEISRQNLTFAKISCKSLKFFTFPSIKMYVTFLDGSTEELGPTEGQSKIGETNHVYYREILRPIRYSNNISHITCFVPPYGSPDWADVTEDWPPDLVDIPIAVTGIPNTRTGKDNKFNGSNTVPPRTTRQPSKHRNRYRGGSVTGPTIRTGKDNFNESKTVPPRITRPPPKQRNRYRGGFNSISSTQEPLMSSSSTQAEDEPSFLQINRTLLIACVAFACILIIVVGIIIAIAITVHKKKIRGLQDKLRELTNEEIQAFFEGSLDVDATGGGSGYGFIQSQPFNKEFEIDRDQIDIFPDKILGSGAYGLVLHGKLKDATASGSGTSTSDGGTVVAVKTVKPNVDTTFFMALLTELKVMCFVGKHANVASLIGAVTTNIKNREVYVALEFCTKGDLLGYIKKHRADFQDLVAKIANANRMYSNLPSNKTATTSYSVGQPSTASAPGHSDSFSTMDLLEWSQQMSSGMEFISSKKVIHGDLAARNVLLTAENVAKISDFGLSRQLHNYSVYTKKSNTPLPWRWMAVESLRDMNFSVQSDVWSYGVTLYEIFELGALPYPGSNWSNEFVKELVDGYRLETPKFGNQEIYNLMMDCMKLEPAERATFPEIFHRLQDIKRSLASHVTSEAGGVYVVC